MTRKLTGNQQVNRKLYIGLPYFHLGMAGEQGYQLSSLQLVGERKHRVQIRAGTSGSQIIPHKLNLCGMICFTAASDHPSLLDAQGDDRVNAVSEML